MNQPTTESKTAEVVAAFKEMQAKGLADLVEARTKEAVAASKRKQIEEVERPGPVELTPPKWVTDPVGAARDEAVLLRKQLDEALARCKRKRIMVCRFPGNGSERMECVDWITRLIRDHKDHPEFDLGIPQKIHDTPVDMCRNRAAAIALENNADYLLMVDNDMGPDCNLGKVAGAKHFLLSSWDFLKLLPPEQPCVIAAPYCGPPPEEFVYVFNWRWTGSVERPDFRGKIEMIPRSEAAHRVGVSQVAALPTGLMLIDCRAFKQLPEPWFYYESADPRWTKKASTEDVTFSRDCALCRIPIYCNWDAWASHMKVMPIGKPIQASVTIVNKRIREIVADGYEPYDAVAEIGAESFTWPPDLPTKKEEMPVEPGAAARPLPVVM